MDQDGIASASPESGVRASSAADLDVSLLTGVTYEFEDGMSSPDVTLRAEISDVTPQGARLVVEKRVKWLGDFSKASYDLSPGDLSALWGIVCEFDAIAWLGRGTRSSYSGRHCNSLLLAVGGQSYYLFDLVDYPETVPPVKDRFYARVFNFFNAFVSADPAMQAAWSDDLPDPADEPRYQDRTAVFRGREVTLKAGTGGDEGYNAEIVELAGARWWADEGLVGYWATTDEDRAMSDGMFPGAQTAELRIGEDGAWRLVLDGAEHVGVMDAVRRYRSDATGAMTSPLPRGVTFSHIDYADGKVWGRGVEDDRASDHLQVTCEPLPHPENPYSFSVRLSRQAGA